MSCQVVRLPNLHWEKGSHPLERKKGPAGDWVLLEFAPGFEDPNPCVRGHIIYVVTGTIELVLRDGVVARAGAGEVVRLDPGTEHRARNPGAEAVTLFVVSDDSAGGRAEHPPVR